MKQLFLFLIACSLMQSIRAQGVFNQDGEMIKKSIEQIILIGTYGQYVKKGYQIMEGGLHSIHDIKDGEFNLHLAYIHSLKKVNPKIKGYDEVQTIQVMATTLIEGCKELVQHTRQSAVMNDEEAVYIKNATNHLLEETSGDLNELNILITSDSLSMTDDERIKEIDRLYNRVVKSYKSYKNLEYNTRRIITGRKQSLKYNKELKQWYGISDKK